LIDFQGRVLHTIDGAAGKEFNLDLSKRARGMYIVHVAEGHRMAYKKVELK
jgi:hypothetical protein